MDASIHDLGWNTADFISRRGYLLSDLPPWMGFMILTLNFQF
jgi:hypothetical protein